MRTVGLQDFQRAVLDNKRPVAVLFGAAYCPACRVMERTLEEFVQLHPDFDAAHVDIGGPDALVLRDRYLWPLGASFSVSLIPVTVLFSGGRPRETLYGAVTGVHLETLLLRLVRGLRGQTVVTQNLSKL